MQIKSKRQNQPCLIVGAGHLVSHVHRVQRDEQQPSYQFNLFRMGEHSEATHGFRPQDLRDIVKACQVLAFSIADDGWLLPTLRQELSELSEELDAVTRQWSDHDED